jgi:hypothetical protein
MTTPLNGISDESWRTAIVCSHLRRDVEEIERLFTSVGPFLPDRIDHMRQSVERLRKIIDAHILQPVRPHGEDQPQRPAVEMAVSDA